MVQLQSDLAEISGAGLQLIGVSYDSVETLKKYADDHDIEYPLLSDEGSETINAYGIRNTSMDGRGAFAGVPNPGTYILDKEGVVQAKLFLERYQDRHSTEQLVAAGKALED